MTKEAERLQQDSWQDWGPYLSDRQWGTVREDYSDYGEAWEYFSHDQARSRAYRWGEDGILGISDRQQNLCFAIALWNGQDPILKERFFGLTGNQGNHGEDVKEYYFYLDSSPTHSYMKGLYKYPQTEYPYSLLESENSNKTRQDPEFELLDTHVFDQDKYYDVFVEYAKNTIDDILIKITIYNRSQESQILHLLPTLWFRNTWSWVKDASKPQLNLVSNNDANTLIKAHHSELGDYYFYCQENPELLFTDNETNYQAIFGYDNGNKYVKDGINNYVINQEQDAVNPEQTGTKFSPHYILNIEAQSSIVVKLRLCKNANLKQPLGSDFEQIFTSRIKETSEFYRQITTSGLTADLQNIQRQAFAGLLWSKQYYHYVVEEWLQGDYNQPLPPESRQKGRNKEWIHLDNQDIISMPDKWEYPWFAAWDLAFHCVPLAIVDPDFAKNQLDIMTREWYMHPNGQIPAYEWNFSDVNPPVHAWATWRVYQIERKYKGQGDRVFLERVFQKLLLNFTWWVNRKDTDGNNIFEGGFLGLDNIGVFDRSSALPTGGYIKQADGTSWMAMYCLNMLTIALELALENPVYEDMATKFFEHFLYIADAMNNIGGDKTELWDDEDGFFYDVLHLPGEQKIKLKVRSMVGLIPLFAVTTLEPEVLDKLPNFKRRLEWFINNRPKLKHNVACMESKGVGARRMLALCYVTVGEYVAVDKLRRILTKLLDENEFFGPYGIRALSRYHKDNPYTFDVDGTQHRVDYEPAESSSGLFGGNSNWRGPVWMPVNYLLIESLQKFHHYLGDDFKVECPTGSGNWMNLWEVSQEISYRLTRIFLKDSQGKRAVYGATEQFQSDLHWQNLILFYEYFHGDNGAGIGASHQTGWTGLVAKLIQQSGEYMQYCQKETC
ncbi:Mannosyl oligosaccharide glucosidase [Xenococcus sp. PCC 7305]|uniref:MGH1-like glycoside hydrolase domain-containing protein n=1 Tax=Xenococcus sp. PCC 7305 TaxID=102125 RepID=UPI0002ACABE1|nr:mannosyl-oligosaccharide glucosidase [Xenococcus sp. PCC 7305]ELS01659.1 Mannosyl oligosaccharide glucosidase [Xenococcus sp. PCC 7305]